MRLQGLEAAGHTGELMHTTAQLPSSSHTVRDRSQGMAHPQLGGSSYLS